MKRGTTYRRGSARRGLRPTRVWADVSGQWLLSVVSVTTAVPVMAMQAPTSLANLTSDPPEDLTILRIVGDYTVALGTANQPGNWSLALLVADVTWTPGATVSVDNDKRLLWQRTYVTPNDIVVWYPPGQVVQNAAGGTYFPTNASETTHIDIAPKVKVEAGKALYLVAYENSGTQVFSTSSVTMRVLFQRSGRR